MIISNFLLLSQLLRFWRSYKISLSLSEFSFGVSKGRKGKREEKEKEKSLFFLSGRVENAKRESKRDDRETSRGCRPYVGGTRR